VKRDPNICADLYLRAFRHLPLALARGKGRDNPDRVRWSSTAPYAPRSSLYECDPSMAGRRRYMVYSSVTAFLDLVFRPRIRRVRRLSFLIAQLSDKLPPSDIIGEVNSPSGVSSDVE
jgi:hypothetical protein